MGANKSLKPTAADTEAVEPSVSMRVVSINVGLPREVQSGGKTVVTSIFKAPVSGTVRMRRLNLDGDQQSDLTAHGGVDKAIYAYPAEHYAWWRAQLLGVALTFGAFGENLTTEGLLEDTTCIGDVLRIGSAECVVTQPRLPCFKLDIRFGRQDMIERLLESGRTGFYLSVSREGDVSVGVPIVRLGRDDAPLTVADIVRLRTTHPADHDLLRRASELPALAQVWRASFRKRLREKPAKP
jgi:MOSC domain-containing protein YiiM